MTPTRIKVPQHSVNGYCPKPEKVQIQKNTTSTEFACIPDPSRVYKKTNQKARNDASKRRQFFDANKHKG